MIQILIKKIGEISFVDRTNAIKDYSVVKGTTKEATTGQLTIDQYGTKYIPEGTDEVEIYDGEDKIFAGFIVRVEQTVSQGPVVTYKCRLLNKVYLLNRKLVNKVYENMTAHDIVIDIVANFSGPGITTANVEDDPAATVVSLPFNNISAPLAIQQIADMFGKEWFVDDDGDINFFSKFSRSAPFNLTDENGNYIFDSLKIIKDFTQIRNSILVNGGEELSTEEKTDNFTADGEQHTWVLSREYTGITVTVDGVEQTVGIANFGTFDDFDVLYDFALRTIYFDPASPPADTLLIAVTGKYYFPISVVYRELSSVAIYGERQFQISEDSIQSREDAIARALAELNAYAAATREGSFETYISGLNAGDKIRINSAVRGVNEDFIIQRLTAKNFSPDKIKWQAEIVSLKTYELIDLLAEIIRGRRVQVNPDAVIRTADRIQRYLKVGRTIDVRAQVEVLRGLLVTRDTRDYLNDPPIWVTGPYHPTSIDDRKRPAFADRGCLIN